MGKKDFKEKSTQTTVYLPITTLQEMDDYINDLGTESLGFPISRSWVMTSALKKYLKDKKCQQPITQ